jgi:hypothetical protein
MPNSSTHFLICRIPSLSLFIKKSGYPWGADPLLKMLLFRLDR